MENFVSESSANKKKYQEDEAIVARQEYDDEITISLMIIEGEYNSRKLQESCKSLQHVAREGCN